MDSSERRKSNTPRRAWANHEVNFIFVWITALIVFVHTIQKWVQKKFDPIAFQCIVLFFSFFSKYLPLKSKKKCWKSSFKIIIKPGIFSAQWSLSLYGSGANVISEHTPNTATTASVSLVSFWTIPTEIRLLWFTISSSSLPLKKKQKMVENFHLTPAMHTWKHCYSLYLMMKIWSDEKPNSVFDQRSDVCSQRRLMFGFPLRFVMKSPVEQ